MTHDRIGNKKQAYAALVAGHCGNYIRNYFSLAEWENREKEHRHWPLWGIRSFKPADPRARLNVPRDEVVRYVTSKFLPDESVSISQMITAKGGNVLWEGDVWRSTEGLMCSGNLAPAPGTWRQHMARPRLWQRTAARLLLENMLNSNSLRDLYGVLDRFEGHVVELSACDFCLGVLPGRNAAVWEVRDY